MASDQAESSVPAASTSAPIKKGQSMLSKKRYTQIEEKFKEILGDREDSDKVLGRLLAEFREIMQFDPDGPTYGARDTSKVIERQKARNIAIKDLANLVRSQLKDNSLP